MNRKAVRIICILMAALLLFGAAYAVVAALFFNA